MRRGRRLAIDVGDARIGVAACAPHGVLATPGERSRIHKSEPTRPRLIGGWGGGGVWARVG
ncbi:Holliday junction resolvase RuvX, partial [Streptomyces sp. NPDC059371]